ncbi:MAG: hypothetical protein ABUS49_06030, partial [Acidobacteriota bacterium]
MAALLVPAANAYIRSFVSYSDGTTAPAKRTDSAGLQFYINGKIAPGLQSSAAGSLVTVFTASSDPVAAIRAAAASWTLSTSNLKFLPLKTTDQVNDPSDNQMTVVVGSTPADLSAVGGALAVTAITIAPAVAGMEDSKGIIQDSDIILNPANSFSTDM